MTKEQKLEILMLLSALESWTFSLQKTLPDYLHEEIKNAMRLLSQEVLDGEKET